MCVVYQIFSVRSAFGTCHHATFSICSVSAGSYSYVCPFSCCSIDPDGWTVDPSFPGVAPCKRGWQRTGLLLCMYGAEKLNPNNIEKAHGSTTASSSSIPQSDDGRCTWQRKLQRQQHGWRKICFSWQPAVGVCLCSEPPLRIV